jgi:diaminopimelate epimerase
MRAAMTGRFHKMHGLGNDFVVIDAREEAVGMTTARARAIADRRTGIGCDQLILVEPSDTADATMRIWNSDGSEVEACGNAMRALAVLIGKATLATKGGVVRIAPGDAGATVEIGAPLFGWRDIPLAYAMDTAAMPVGWEGLDAPMAVNVGNPHLVFFIDDLDAIDIERLGPIIETEALFPERINVNVAQVIDAGHIRLRTWERGAGLTLACGTGACATVVAAIRSRRAIGPVEVAMTGGALTIDWSEGKPIHMTGPATHVFTGKADWSAFGA